MVKFSGPFSNSIQSKGLVGEIGCVKIWELICDLRRRRTFYIRELPMFENIFSLLKGVILSQDRDKWILKHSR